MGVTTKPQLNQQVTSYGHSFKWTDLHKSADELNQLVYSYDKLATDALDQLDEIAPPTKHQHARDNFKLVKEHASEGGLVGELWDQINTVPDWVDWKQIERGQKVYWRYIGPATVALGQQSLLGSFVYGRAVKVLGSTGAWTPENVQRRLLETAQHTFDVQRDLKSLQPGGDGWEASIRVRLLHASVRRRIMHLAREKRGYYDMEADGIPINDMDCIITMNDFSSLIMYLGIPRQGVYPNKQEIADYLAVWRYVCYIMGTPNSFLETPEKAKAMMESIILSETKPNKATDIISNNMINGLVGRAPGFASRGFLVALAHWVNGTEIATALGIEKPSLYHKSLVAAQCWIFILLAQSRKIVPFVDDHINELSKKAVYDRLVYDKSKGALGYKTKFGFKWVPSLDYKTTLGTASADHIKNSGAFSHVGPETAALATIVLTGAFATVGVWSSVKMAMKLQMNWLSRP